MMLISSCFPYIALNKMGCLKLKYQDKSYYPFGMAMVSYKQEEFSSYRYGNNTQERDDEIYGEGNSYSAEYWQYDARIGRRWNIDPVFKEYESPYACNGNNPIFLVDPNGADTITYDDNGKEISRKIAQPDDKDVFLRLAVDGSFSWNGKNYDRGHSYNSLFGDPDGNEKPTKYKAIDKTSITSLGSFVQGAELDRVWLLLTGDKLTFWLNSGYKGTYDYKNKGVLGKNGESTVYEVDGIIYNRRELGMMKWGYVASAVYKDDSYKTLKLQNRLMHLSVEGNGDEWNEMWSWSFGFNFGKYTSLQAPTVARVEAASLLAESNLRSNLSSMYWNLKYPYRSDPDFVENKDPSGFMTNIKRALMF